MNAAVSRPPHDRAHGKTGLGNPCVNDARTQIIWHFDGSTTRWTYCLIPWKSQVDYVEAAEVLLHGARFPKELNGLQTRLDRSRTSVIKCDSSCARNTRDAFQAVTRGPTLESSVACCAEETTSTRTIRGSDRDGKFPWMPLMAILAGAGGGVQLPQSNPCPPSLTPSVRP